MSSASALVSCDPKTFEWDKTLSDLRERGLNSCCKVDPTRVPSLFALSLRSAVNVPDSRGETLFSTLLRNGDLEFLRLALPSKDLTVKERLKGFLICNASSEGGLIKSHAQATAVFEALDREAPSLEIAKPDAFPCEYLLGGSKPDIDVNKELRDYIKSVQDPDTLRVVIPKFLAQGAYLNPPEDDENGKSLLNTAIASKNMVALRVLLEMGANVNSADSEDATPLITAIQKENLAAFDFLLEKGADVNPLINYPPLIFAVNHKNLDMVQKLLRAHANANRGIPKIESPLTAASYSCRIEIIEELLKAGAEVDDCNSQFERTPLMWAILNNEDPRSVDMLIKAGANLYAVDTHGQTPLTHAIREKKDEALQMLISAGVDINAKIGENHTALTYAIGSGNIGALKLLLDGGANIDSQNTKGLTALISAVDYNQPEALKELIARKANFDLETQDGFTALTAAIDQDKVEMVKLLLDAHVNVNHENEKGFTPAIFAVGSSNPEVLRLLIEKEVDVNAENKHGLTPAICAIQGDKLDALRLLIEKGVNVNAENKHGLTPVIRAIQADNLNALRLLIENGVDVNAANRDGLTPLMFALGQNKLGALPVLKAAGADVNAEDHNKMTPLLFAIKRSDTAALNELIRLGANVNAANQDGVTPLGFAFNHGRRNCIKILAAAGAEMRSEEYLKSAASAA